MSQYASDIISSAGWSHFEVLDEDNGDKTITQNLKTNFSMNAPMPEYIRKLVAKDKYPDFHNELVVAIDMAIVLDDVCFNKDANLWEWTGSKYYFTTPNDETVCKVDILHVVGFPDERSTSPDYQYINIDIDEKSKMRLVQAIQKLMEEKQRQDVVTQGVKSLLESRKSRDERGEDQDFPF